MHSARRLNFTYPRRLRQPLIYFKIKTAAWLIAAFVIVSGAAFGQSGGRQKEGKVKTKRRGNHILTQYKSHGHADEFAKGSSGRKGKIARLFKRDKPAWTYKRTGSAKSNARENRFLFTWSRSKGRAENAATQDRQNKMRDRKRQKGNKTFKFRKHKRKKP